MQVEVGEFDEGAEETEEEVVAESRSLSRVLSYPVFALPRLSLGHGDSLREVPAQGNSGWAPPCRVGCGGETALKGWESSLESGHDLCIARLSML